ncbi:MAG: DUF11 domain-containing protein [Solirubrobacterales bacterium]|nr:DUF11 domain-containing protein [Solirubrobacterales bacterium]
MRLLALIVALTATVASWAFASQAEAAKVGNPGTFGATVTNGTIRIGTTSFGFDNSDPITFAGTVTAAGDVNVPTSGQHFPSFEVEGYPVSIIPTNALTGNINPLTGAGSLRLRVYIKIDNVPLASGCAIASSSSPIDLNMLITGTTSPPGPNTPISGTPYNPSNGTVKFVNNSFSVPASNSCGLGASTVDGALGLPSAAGNNEAQFDVAVSPILTKGVNASYTVTPSTGPAPLTSTFNASASTVAAGVKTCTPALPSTPNCGYRWDFDGNGTVDQVTNTASTSNVYAVPGTYVSKLTIYDNDGDTDNTTRTVVVSGRPDLTIDKSHTGNFQSGTQGTYKIDVKNNGPDALGPTTGTITVTDTLPAGLNYVSATGSGWTCLGPANVVTCTRSTAIAVGGSAPQITLTVAATDAARPSVTNTASVTTPVETATTNNSDSDPTTVDSIDVAIQKSHTGSFRVGRNEPYSLRVRNDGTLPTSGTTTVSDTLPTGMNYFSSSAPAGWSCNGSGPSFSCTHSDPLPAGYDETITLTVAVDGTALPARTNTATISTPGDTDPSDDSSSDPTVVVAAPDLAIVKSHDGNFRVGDTGTYELDVTNDGALPTVGTTTVTDTVPAGLPVVSADGTGWSCDVQGQEVTCTNPTVLQPDESLPTISIVTDVEQAAMPQVTNTATVATSGTGPAADPNPANDTDADATTVTAIDLTIDKAHTGTFPIGGNGTFTLAVSNTGTAATVGTTTVTDTLPADLSYVSAAGSGWSCGASGQDVTCTRAATIGAGSSAPTITLNVAIGNTTADDVTNTATVAVTDDINSGNDSDSDTAPLTAADLQITKSHSGDFRVGTNRVYDLKVKNVGPLPSSGTSTVTDVLPAGLTYVSATGPNWSCGNVGQTVTCTRSASIPAGGPASTIQLTVAVGAAAAPSLTNTASVANAGDRNPANDSSADPTTVTAIDLAISKSHSGQLTAGGSATYDIDVDNEGTAATQGAATVTDTLPSGLTYSGFTGDDWDCSATGQVVTCDHPAGIPAGGSASSLKLRVHVAASAGYQITNTASVSTPDDVASANNSDDDTSGVGRIDLTIDKTLGPDGLPRGGQTSYTLDVDNLGDLGTQGATRVTDTLPAGLSYVSASGTGWDCGFASGAVTCTRSATIAGGGSADPIEIGVRVDANAPSSITNSAEVDTQADSEPSNDSDSVTGSPTGAVPDIALTMSRNGPLRNGATGTFSLSARNVGSGPTTGATTITMTLIGSSYVSGSGSGWSCSGGTNAATCTHAGAIAPGTRSDLELDVRVDKAAAVAITSGSVATPGDTNSGNNTVSDASITDKLDVGASISHSGDFSVGGTGTFTITASSNGTVATNGTTTLRVPLPDALDYVSASGSGWTCTQSGSDAVCDHPGAIAPGSSSSVDLQVKPIIGGSASVTATLATQDDLEASNDSATDSVDVSGGPGGALQLKKAKIKVPKSGQVPVPASCPSGGGACTGTLTLSVKGKPVGTAKYDVAAGGSATVTVPLAKKAKKTLAKKGKLKVVATAGSSTAKLKLTQPKKK